MAEGETTDWEHWASINRWVRKYGPGMTGNVWCNGSYAVFVKDEPRAIISDYTPPQGDLKLARQLCDRAMVEYLKKKIQGLQEVLDLLPEEYLTVDQTRRVISALSAQIKS